MMRPMNVELSITKCAGFTTAPGAALFSVVRNEMYFMPHFLRHYRALGLREFWFLDDSSTDGTGDYLLSQPDCAVIRSNHKFGDRIGTQSFGIYVRTLVPRNLLQGRWVLNVDADEFLLLPPPFKVLDDLTRALEAQKLRVARALMLDFFPPTLRSIEHAAADADPFTLCPHFDVFETVDWPDGATMPVNVSLRDGVRPRMFSNLKRSAEMTQLLSGGEYRHGSVNKVPLLFWGPDTAMGTAHRSNVPPSDRVQLSLAHFKFFPGYREKIADAIAVKGHWKDAIEYRFLDIATRELEDVALAGPRSRRFGSVQDLVDAGLLYSRLPPVAA
jgi:hypothetical protein